MPFKDVSLPFGSWNPDSASLANPTNEAKNVVPGESGYGPLPGLAAVTGATLTARCQGARAFQDTDGAVTIVAGDAGKLYKRFADSFQDKSGGQTFACPADGWWQFEQFDSRIVATNIGNVPQAMSPGGTFAALAGSPPRARYVLQDRQERRLILANTIEPGPNDLHPSRVRWSGQNDIVVWDDTERSSGAGYQDMPEAGGWVQGLVGYPYPTVFQERMIRRMAGLTGEPFYGFDTISDGVGALCPGPAIVSWGARTFFIAEDGFYVWDGAAATPIGDGRVNKWFRANMDYRLRHLVCGAYDPANRLVMWLFPTSFSGTSYAGGARVAIFSLKENRWSWGEVSAEMLLSAPDRGYTLEEVDAASEDLDALLWSLDSRIWAGGKVVIGAFNQAHTLAAFSGPALAATIDTVEKEAVPGYRARISELRPLVDNSTGTVTGQIGTRAQKAGDPVLYSTATNQNDAGFCPQNRTGRYFRGRVNIPAGAAWTHAQGVQIRVKPEGRR